jgi:hypothetical protein
MAVSPPREKPEEQKSDLHCAEFVKIILVCHFKINVEGKTGSGFFYFFYFLFFFLLFFPKKHVLLLWKIIKQLWSSYEVDIQVFQPFIGCFLSGNLSGCLPQMRATIEDFHVDMQKCCFFLKCCFFNHTRYNM